MGRLNMLKSSRIKNKFILAADVSFENVGLSMFRYRENGIFDLVDVTTVRSPKDNSKRHLYVTEQHVERIRITILGMARFVKRNLDRRYDDIIVVCELPSSGSQSSAASHCMGMAKGTFVVFCL